MRVSKADPAVFIGLCAAAGVGKPVPEFQFASERGWKFDWAWPSYRIALEVEGGAYRGHGHRSVGKFLRDMEKYNAAAIAAWRVLRCTVDEFNDGTGLELVMRAVEASKV